MSLKVYTAYRLRKSSDLWDFCTDAKKRGQEEVKKVLRKVYIECCNGVNIDSEEYKSCLSIYKSDIKARLTVVDRFLNKMYRAQAARSQRNYFDFNVSVTFRERRGRVYLIPYSDMVMRHTLDFLNEDPRLEGYSYWNNSDPPKNISTQEWKRRGKIWNEICDINWGRYLTLEICSPDSYWEVSPWSDLLTEFKDNEWSPKSQLQDEVKNAIILDTNGKIFTPEPKNSESESPYRAESVKGK